MGESVATSAAGPAAAASTRIVKVIYYVRHGESLVNAAIHDALLKAGLPPADSFGTKEARAVTYPVMNDPAMFDTGLSEKGIQQARTLARQGVTAGRPQSVELVVSSSLSRAIHTAALVFPSEEGYPRPILCLDETREFAGPPLSEKRHAASEMHAHIKATVGLCAEELDVSRVPEVDNVWRPAEESGSSAFARADRALDFLMARPERVIACVGHTSFMARCMLGGKNKSIVVEAADTERKRLQFPFQNCEVRAVEMWIDAADRKYHVRPLQVLPYHPGARL
eukprot:gnl/TRDRNA2_/TRDRNA2_29060_c0_seq2.p1 gnl/TRDRNA2_/TRDRNA2_29060_c0~~gnl/TRDRNA2_/TRDRNA2_29060_c0_seq2.p1  ORF type:complete len:282 (+),score=33.17 gnl/TRDRNA2_/TRDRNA2_29060_c0_seq2:53-898(+)